MLWHAYFEHTSCSQMAVAQTQIRKHGPMASHGAFWPFEEIKVPPPLSARGSSHQPLGGWPLDGPKALRSAWSPPTNTWQSSCSWPPKKPPIKTHLGLLRLMPCSWTSGNCESKHQQSNCDCDYGSPLTDAISGRLWPQLWHFRVLHLRIEEGLAQVALCRPRLAICFTKFSPKEFRRFNQHTEQKIDEYNSCWYKSSWYKIHDKWTHYINELKWHWLGIFFGFTSPAGNRKVLIDVGGTANLGTPVNCLVVLVSIYNQNLEKLKMLI